MNIKPFFVVFTLIFLTMPVKAVKDKNSSIVTAVEKSQCGIVKNFLAKGVSPNTKFTDYFTNQEIPILFMSISRGDICITNALVSNGADINYIFKFKSGDPIWVREKTPLSVAIFNSYQSKSLDIIKILLSSRVQAELKASDGITFVEHALNNWKMTRTITETDANKLIKDINELISKSKI